MSNSSSVKKITVDFTVNEYKGITLFTGRKNGKKAKSNFSISNADRFEFIGNADQVVTSSFFLGLVGDELKVIFNEVGSINKLIEHVDLDKLNAVSKNECIRAIKRGLLSSDVSL